MIETAKRFNVVNCGRRFGKSLLGEDRIIHPAIAGYPVAWFSPTYKMLAEIWRDLTRLLAPIITASNASDRRIDLAGGGVIDLWSLDHPNIARGRKYKRVIIDEAAMIRHLQDAWQSVIRPTLADLIGDAWFLSTPKGHNFFWTIYQRGLDPDETDWACWQRPTSANPFIAAQEIESARRELPERVFQQEFLAEFIDDAGGVFRHVMDATSAIEQREAITGHEYAIGIDWGKFQDFTVFAVIDITLKALVSLDRFQKIDYPVQISRLQALTERFRPRVLIPEQNSMGAPQVDALMRARWAPQVLPFTTTNATKAAIIDGLALAFERREISILPDPVLVAELQAFEAERLPSGMLRYAAPEGMHDDLVIGLALAWSALKSGRPSLAGVSIGGSTQRPIYERSSDSRGGYDDGED